MAKRAAPKKTDHPGSAFANDSAIPIVNIQGLNLLRATEGLGPKRHRETADLRAALADVVLEYTTLKRRDQIAHGVAPEDAIPIVDDYDPVIAMALIGVKTRNKELALSAHSKVAEYVRPKLKSVEVIADAAKSQDLAARNAKAATLLDAIDEVARARRLAYDADVEEHGIRLDEPEK